MHCNKDALKGDEKTLKGDEEALKCKRCVKSGREH